VYQALSYQCFRPQATRLNEFFFFKSGILGDLDEKTGLQQFIVGTLEEAFQYDLPVPGTHFTRFPGTKVQTLTLSGRRRGRDRAGGVRLRRGRGLRVRIGCFIAGMRP